ncbi:hypothetical protein [Halobaculum sp. EA56]|uniref:hypothetical protein n=1 Tax=Halobaculum sp. EA56 TaxID=3421648 RepID=UPI003EBED521
MDERTDREGPVAAVQDAAVEHALTVGDSRRALALVGALDPLRGSSAEDPALTALSTTLTAWVGLREREPAFGAAPPTPPSPAVPDPATDRPASTPTPEGGGGDGAEADRADDRGRDHVRDHPAAAVGAAVACERFGLAPARAASLAGRSVEAVERALADRRGNDPPADR